jgi:4-hydroxybenzoate polyprenyltransferase
LKRFLPVLELLVYTNIWVALAVTALCALTFAFIGVFDYHLLWFVFFATLLMYAYARWFDSPAREEANVSQITLWTENNKVLYWLSGIVGLLGTIWFGLKLSSDTWPWLAVCGGISAMYPLQFFKRGGEALRNITGLKLFIISAVWALVSTVLPAAQVGEPIDFDVAVLTLQRFFFIMAITIPFDIRDLRIDSPSINTLPLLFGVKRARTIALISLLIAEAGALGLYFGGLFSVGELIGQIVAFEITSLLIYRSTPKKPDLYFSFGIEATSIILFFGVWVFNYFWP